MKKIKEGDILELLLVDRNEYECKCHPKKKMTKVEVIGVYEHHVLVRNIKTGVKESFTWWDLWKLSGGKGKADA